MQPFIYWFGLVFMRLNKFKLSILLVSFHLSLFGQPAYDPIKTNVDEINPIFAIIERKSPKGVFKEKIYKKEEERIKQLQEDETIEFVDYEIVNIDQVVGYWVLKESNRNCCWGPDDCKIWVRAEMDLVYSDSIYLYKEKDLIYSESEIFPNPATDYLNIISNTKILQAKIFNVLGQEVFRINLESKNEEILINHLVTGVYTIQLEFANELRVHEFIKS